LNPGSRNFGNWISDVVGTPWAPFCCPSQAEI
jgi:hypothetical protein